MNPPEVLYSIELAIPNRHGINPSLVIGRRMCADCREQTGDASIIATPPRGLIMRVSSCCRRKRDYLGSKAPLAEIAFRVIISRRNRGQSATEISRTILASRTQEFIRNIDPAVLATLMATDDYYGFTPEETEAEPPVRDDALTPTSL